MPILDTTVQGEPDGNRYWGLLYSDRLNDHVDYMIEGNKPNASIQLTRNDGGSGWPTSLVLTVKDSNDGITYTAHASTLTYINASDLVVNGGISVVSRFLRVEVTTASSQAVPIRVSFYEYD